MSLDSIKKRERFSKDDSGFQPGEKVEIIHESILTRFPNIEKIGTIQSIKEDGGRIVKVFDHNKNKYKTLNIGLKSTLKKVSFVPDGLFEM